MSGPCRRDFDPTSLFRRYEGNPILTREDWPYPANAVFNPGAVECGGQTVLLARVEDMRGYSHLTVARSPDGRSGWEVSSRPALEPDPSCLEERWGIEDPRIVWVEELGEYAVTCVTFSRGGPVVSLYTTRDFVEFRRHGPLLPPEDKDASLFPRRVGGRFVLMHRPIIRGEAHIWMAFSPDLKHWGDHRMVIPARPGSWDSSRVGLGPPPIETPQGWLVMYHGVRVTASGSLYRVGLALLDLDEPWRVIRRSEEWVFGPRYRYEHVGDVPGVTFPTGAIVDQSTGELRIYYGAADTAICLAFAHKDEVLEYMSRCRSPE
ncbi:MAG: glycosidase [Bacillota bacterium]|nr:glycosidase [Bacillota bacterium]